MKFAQRKTCQICEIEWYKVHWIQFSQWHIPATRGESGVWKMNKLYEKMSLHSNFFSLKKKSSTLKIKKKPNTPNFEDLNAQQIKCIVRINQMHCTWHNAKGINQFNSIFCESDESDFGRVRKCTIFLP